MKALGHPWLGTLTAWVREAFQGTRISMVGRFWLPAYPKALKQVVVCDLCRRVESARQLAERLWAIKSGSNLRQRQLHARWVVPVAEELIYIPEDNLT